MPEPDPALKHLEKLVGIWKIKGRTLDSKKDNISGRINIEWLPGGFFLQLGNILSGGWRPEEGTKKIPENTYDATMTRVNKNQTPLHNQQGDPSPEHGSISIRQPDEYSDISINHLGYN